ncbi:MAG: hypothetical protein IJ387_11080, partial [Thermoguttaceae bacterium]|nr:hypothetical protein [Thermoguttaceae bacterium]
LLYAISSVLEIAIRRFREILFRSEERCGGDQEDALTLPILTLKRVYVGRRLDVVYNMSYITY